MNAKLWDYGRAKSGPTEAQTTRVMGSEGYCDPHYLATGIFSSFYSMPIN